MFNKYDNQILRELYPNYHDGTIAYKMKRTVAEIQKQAKFIGIYFKKEKNFWEIHEREELLASFKNMSREDLCKKFRRSYFSILNQYNKLTLNK
jgi:hypothetical protein